MSKKKSMQELFDQARAESKITTSSEHNIAIVLSNKLHKTSEEFKKTIKNRWDDPEERKKQSKRLTKHLAENPRELTKEQQAIKSKKISEGIRKWHNDPENSKKFKKAIAERSEREPTKAQVEGYKKSGANHKKPFVTPIGTFSGFQESAKALGIAVGSLPTRQKSLPHLYYYEKDGPGEPTYETIWNTPYGKTGHYGGKGDLAKRAGIILKPNFGFKRWFEENAKVDPDNWYTSEEIKQDITYVRKKG